MPRFDTCTPKMIIVCCHHRHHNHYYISLYITIYHCISLCIIYIYVFYLTVYHCISYVYICQSRSLCITMTLPGISPLPIEAGLLVPSDALLVASTRHGTRVAVVVINEPHGVETQGLGFLWLIATKIGECIGQYTGNLIQMLNSYGIHEKYEKHHRTIIGKYWKHLSAFVGAAIPAKCGEKGKQHPTCLSLIGGFNFPQCNLEGPNAPA